MNDQYLAEKLVYVKDHFPQVAGRYEKGIEIYRANHWQHLANDDKAVIVPSQSQPNAVHLVTDEGAIIRCTCSDYYHNAPAIRGQKMCKHVIAAQIFWHNGPFPQVTS